MRHTRQAYSILDECMRRPLIDDWWRSLVPELAKIEVPALICGSFSDNNLHSRGSIAAFEQISSVDRHLYTHRGGKWATFYDDEARTAQLQFFDRKPPWAVHSAAAEGPPRGREAGDQIVEVRDEASWPLERALDPDVPVRRRLARAPARRVGLDQLRDSIEGCAVRLDGAGRC